MNEDTDDPKSIMVLDLGGVMIENERQYRITKAVSEKFERALADVGRSTDRNPDVHPLLVRTQEDALRSQLDDLRAELREYEARRADA